MSGREREVGRHTAYDTGGFGVGLWVWSSAVVGLVVFFKVFLSGQSLARLPGGLMDVHYFCLFMCSDFTCHCIVGKTERERRPCRYLCVLFFVGCVVI